MKEQHLDFGDCDCGCRNELNLDKLCVKKFKVKTLCACRVESKEACITGRLDAQDAYFKDVDVTGDVCANRVTADDISAKHACFDTLDLSTSLCTPLLSTPAVCTGDVKTTTLNAASICASNVNATLGSFQSLVANEVCLPGTTRAADLRACGKQRATAAYSAPTSYTLGDWLQFNSVLDDPDSGITQVPHTTYTAPLSGYYSLTLQVDQLDLVTTDPILGTPFADIQVWVNGVSVRNAFSSYIPFLNQQKGCFSTLISLNAGDLLAFKYRLIALNATGPFEVAGSVTVDGNGTEFNSTMFKIQLLTVNCTDLPCGPSVECQKLTCTPCTPVSTDCRSCIPETPSDCDHCFRPPTAGSEEHCNSCE